MGLRDRFKRGKKGHSGVNDDEAEDAPALGESGRAEISHDEAVAIARLKRAAVKIYAWRADGFGYSPKVTHTKYTSCLGGCITIMITVLILFNMAMTLYVYANGSVTVRTEFKDVAMETDEVDVWDTVVMSFKDSGGSGYYDDTVFKYRMYQVTNSGTNEVTTSMTSGTSCGITDGPTGTLWYGESTAQCLLTSGDTTAVFRGVPDRGSSVYKYLRIEVEDVSGTGYTTFGDGTLSVGVAQWSPESLTETPGLFETYFTRLFSPSFFTGRMIEPVKLTPPTVVAGFDVTMPDAQACTMDVGVMKGNVTWAPRYGFDYYGTGAFPVLRDPAPKNCRTLTNAAGTTLLTINFKFQRLREAAIYDRGSLVNLLTMWGGFWIGLIMFVGSFAKCYNRAMFAWMMRDNDLREMDHEAFTASGRLKKAAAYELPKELEDTDT